MEIIKAIVLAIIQGITEWLPISSSAHLAIASRIFNIEPDLFYYVILHFATMLSLIVYFRKDIKPYFYDPTKRFLVSLKGWWIITASIPVFFSGFFLYDIVNILFSEMRIIGIALLVNAALLFGTQFMHTKHIITFPKALTIGLAQALSIIPGISRSGITAATGFYLNLRREEIISFAMMLALPIMLGATAYMAVTTPFSHITIPMIIGFFVAFVCGYIAIHILIQKILKGTFSTFWLYCAIIGVILLFN